MHLRKQGLTYHQIAEQVGISYQHVAVVVTGKKYLKAEKVLSEEEYNRNRERMRELYKRRKKLWDLGILY